MVIENNLMKDIYKKALKFSTKQIPILLLGETGVGKGELAKYIYKKSKRKGQFIQLNCASFSESLIESELFGYKKGAFTGAEKDKIGLVKLADGGTLFLDEIGEMNLSAQAKLLQVLDNNEYFPIGSLNPEKSSFQLICATNQDLRSKVQGKKFREDLFYRISAAVLEIPPLKDRIDEIPFLVEHFIEEFYKKESYNKEIKISPNIYEFFLCYEWPGNIRELKNVIWAALTLMDENENILDVKHLPKENFSTFSCQLYDNNFLPLRDREKCFKVTLISQALKFTNNDIKKVKDILKISEDTIYRAKKGGGNNKMNN